MRPLDIQTSLTDRQTDRQTSRQTDKQTDRQADRQTSRQTDRLLSRQAIEKNRWTDNAENARQTD
jgi:hypothetical protein